MARNIFMMLILIFLNQFLTQNNLRHGVTLIILGQFPGHIEDFLTRPYEFFRLAVAFQTPFHIEGVDFPHQRHLVNLPVTGLTRNTFVNMDAVIEVNKIGKIVNPHPFNGVARAITFTNRF